MTERRANYRSDCGTVIFAQFPDQSRRPLFLDGAEAFAEYRTGADAEASCRPVQLTLDLPEIRRPEQA
jgi:hypothetical protein